MTTKVTEQTLQLLKEKIVREVQDYSIVLMDLEGTILTWNRGVQVIKGYSEPEIIGQNFRVFYMPRERDAKLPEQLLELAKREGRAKHIGRRVRKNGSLFWASTVISTIHDDNDGAPIGFTKVTRELRDNEFE